MLLLLFFCLFVCFLTLPIYPASWGKSHSDRFDSRNQMAFTGSPLAWESNRHLATLPLVSPPHGVWKTRAEIPYWWRVTNQNWVVLLIGHAAWEIWFNQSEALSSSAWVVTRRRYGISALVFQTSFSGETSGSVAKCRLFSQTKAPPERGTFGPQVYERVRISQHWKLKRSVSAPTCQFSTAGQSLIQPFLEPLEHNLGQKSSIKRLFQPTVGPISALGPNQP